MAKFLRILIAVLILTQISLTLADLPPEEEPDSGWQFLVSPYAWMTGINGKIGIRDLDKKVDISPGRFLEHSLKHGAFAGGLRVEARRNRWTWMLDPTYLKLSATKSWRLSPGSIGVGLKLALVDLGVFYQLDPPDVDSTNHIQFLAGGRYFGLDSNLNFAPPFTVLNAREQSVVPIVGVRWIAALASKFYLRVRGDVGGFGIDKMNFTWSTILMAGYPFSDHIDLTGGFRAVGIDYRKGFFKMNTTYYGPFLGLAFVF